MAVGRWRWMNAGGETPEAECGGGLSFFLSFFLSFLSSLAADDESDEDNKRAIRN